MIYLIAIAFIAGIVTILSPCILPILPVVLAGTVGEGKRRPFGIITGFIVSFTFFTLFTSYLVKSFGLDANLLRSFSIAIIAFIGVTLLISQFQKLSEKLFSKIATLAPRSTAGGFLGGFITGLSIGLLWTPCVGPILAAVITLSFTATVSYGIFFIMLAYALGTAIPMIAIIYLGRSLFAKIPFLLKNLNYVQKIFGIIMILTAIGIATNTDRKIQTYLLTQFPQWGAGLTAIEENSKVKQELSNLQTTEKKNFTENLQAAPELQVGGEWFNSKPLTVAELKGKVVLVDFWTYTCINCIRTLPNIRSWNEKYADKGLVIIGVHAPEFEFEKDPVNVRKAITDYKLTYPIMQDNDFTTWRAYDNHYWPAKYLIDREGKIRYTHFGEGKYDETEAEIQKLLKEGDNSLQLGTIQNKEETIQTRTPELYLGFGRMDALDVNERVITDTPTPYTPRQSNPPKNSFDYTGTVTISKEYANPQKGTTFRLNYESQNVYLVMRALKDKSTVRVLLDGKPITSEYAGEDVKDGLVTIEKDKLYNLVKSTKQENHVVTIEFMDSNTEIFALTFG